MAKIQRLEEQAIRQIAAGEVVERPANAVKELIENSLDAGSKRITLEIENGGRGMIRISDDGCGMVPEDALLSLERHTTSKIQSVTDLETLTTFGFRGEALPSIAAVSKMELSTRPANQPHGFAMKLSAGKIVSKQECGRAAGTTIEVRELFFNTPARLKFLKSDATEKNKILRTFEEIAIAHPQIAFHSVFENKKTREWAGRDQPIDRLRDLWGTEFSEETMIPLSFRHSLLQIEGWVSKPDSHQATKSHQIFYVNRRPIVSRFLSHALYESYRDCLPVGRHPAAVLFITLDPSQIDVNVHPSKREVRFQNEHQIYESLIREIRLKRSQLSSAPKVFSASSVSSDPVTINGSALIETQPFPQTVPFSSEPGHAAGAGPSRPFQGKQQQIFAQQPRVLTQFHSLYVIAEQGENLMIVDQHAAGERILYEQFRKAILTNQSIATQVLLLPYHWNVTLTQAELLKNHLPLFLKLGFSLEPFGEKTFRIKEIPAVVQGSELENILGEMMAALENSKQPTIAIEEQIMHSACRAAIKANDTLSVKELSQLLEDLSQCDNPHTCPHGRPTTLTISRQELDKKFGRT